MPQGSLEISQDHLRKHIQALAGVRHPEINPAALEQAAQYIEAEFDQLGYAPHAQVFAYNDRPYRNIIASREGQKHPDEMVIVMAHFDSEAITPGADDNASGVAAMLEVARLFRSTQFERTVQFVAVNLEEAAPGGNINTGVRGSRAYAAQARQNDQKIVGVIVLETIAYAGEELPQKAPPGLPFNLPEFGNFISVIGNQVSAGLVEGFASAAQTLEPPLPCVPLVVPGNGEVLPDTRRSDHSPFWDAGYPAVMVTDTANFRNPHYHQPTDTLDTLNLPFTAQVGRATAALVRELAVALE